MTVTEGVTIAAGSRGDPERNYSPKDWRRNAFTVGRVPDVPAHWRGCIPDPSVERRTQGAEGDGIVPVGLLGDRFSNLSVLIYAKIYSWFFEFEGFFGPRDLAQALYRPPVTADHLNKINAAIQSLSGNWLQRGRRGDYRVDFCQPPGNRHGMIRGEQFAELLLEAGSPDRTIVAADLVNFARWRHECVTGWTVESTDRLAAKWHVGRTVVRASRDRLANLGWLVVLPRKGQRSEEDPLVWISELYDPDLDIVDLGGVSTLYTASGPPPTGARNTHPQGLAGAAIAVGPRRHDLRLHPASVRLTASPEPALPQKIAAEDPAPCPIRGQLRPQSPPTKELGTDTGIDQPDDRAIGPAETEARPDVRGFRLGRAKRRRRALLDLVAPDHQVRQSAGPSRPYEVYLIHFPEEGCFKVGLTHSESHRISHFSRHGGILVDRVAVDCKALAEIIEADVLELTADWHRLGDRKRPGSGYTEMWSDEGPTVDLDQVRSQATRFVAHLQGLMTEEPR